MKILPKGGDNLGTALPSTIELGGTEVQGNAADRSTESPSATTSFSTQGQDIAKAKAAVEAAPDVREELVSQLKSLVDSDGYSVDVEEVALAMIRGVPAESDETASRRKYLMSLDTKNTASMAASANALKSTRNRAVQRPAEANAELINSLSSGRVDSSAQVALLESENQTSYDQERANLLRGALTSGQAARIMNLPPDSVAELANSGGLLAILHRGKVRYPAWQFQPGDADSAVVGLRQTLRLLALSPVEKMFWLGRPNSTFEGRAPIELLKSGETKRVVEAARAVGVN